MDFAYSDKVKALQAKLSAFMDEHIYPNEHRFHAGDPGEPQARASAWTPTQIIEELKPKARAAGPVEPVPAAFEARARRRCPTSSTRRCARSWAACRSRAEVFNCSAPDTGNMETHRALRQRGAARASGSSRCCAARSARAFPMTEPAVASSDATNIECRIERQGDDYVINGRKWWTSGAGDPRCKLYIFMGKTDPGRAAAHPAVDDPGAGATRPGVKVVRALSVFGYDDAPHGHMEVDFKDVRVPASNILLGEGRGFEIAQGRLGPGPHPPLHAPDRPGRARARADVQALAVARRLRQDRSPSRA